LNTKFTPGPWKVLAEESDKDYLRIRGTRLGDRYKIANVIKPTYWGVHPREAEETRANASLIAAAPDLLEALDDLLNWMPRVEPAEGQQEAVDASIERAAHLLAKAAPARFGAYTSKASLQMDRPQESN
jgi:hypothetical protein